MCCWADHGSLCSLLGVGGHPVAMETRGLQQRDGHRGAALLRLAARTHAHERVSTLT